MNKAVFLDRDGVINSKGKSYYIHREEEFLFNKGVFEALRHFISKGYLLIIITNQGGIARGIYNEAQLEKLHKFMLCELEKAGISITDIFFCPHHPDFGECLCRKPGTLLFEQAIKKYDIDPSSSFMIGDSETDIIPARKMGITGIMIPTNGNMMELVVNTGKI
jgi:D-glycero-D-manno-heptose 1,7-bisphosphate phosphatase